MSANTAADWMSAVSEKSTSKRSSGGLGAQLDDLVTEIDQRETGAAADTARPNAVAREAVGGGDARGATESDTPAVELAAQLDDLLAEIGQIGKELGSQVDDPEAEEKGLDVIERVMDQQIDTEPTAQGAHGGVTLEEPEEVPSGRTNVVVSGEEVDQLMSEIDQMLASKAEDAVEGDFETNVNADAETSTAEEDEDLPTKVMAVLGKAATANLENSIVSDAAATDAVEEEGVEGSFETPEQVLGVEEIARRSPSPEKKKEEPLVVGGGFTADAAAVAKELDEQPEMKVVVPTAVPVVPVEAAESKEPEAAEKQGVEEQTGLLLRLCAMVNSPLAGFSPQTRDAVGWAGLVTLFPASMLMVFWLMKSLF